MVRQKSSVSIRIHPTTRRSLAPNTCSRKSQFVECPQDQMLEKIGPTLVASAITNDKEGERQLTDATNIDRLNIGPIPTTKLDWLQPHEGNIVDFLFRARAFQIPQERLVGRA